MKKINLIPLLFFLLFSCASEEQNKAFSEIANLYGCKVEYTKGFSASTEKGNAKYYELTISNCELVDNEEIEPGMIGSNSALIVFKSLSKDERSDYDKINIEVKKNSKNSEVIASFEYSISLLKSIEEQQKIITSFCESMKSKDVKKCYSYLNSFVKKDITLEQMDTITKKLDEKYGNIKDFQNHGFKFTKFTDETTNTNKDVLCFHESFLREKVDTHMEICIDTNERVQKIYALNF